MEQIQKDTIKDMFQYYLADENKIFKLIDDLDVYHKLTNAVINAKRYAVLENFGQFIKIDEKNKCLVVDLILIDDRSAVQIKGVINELKRTESDDYADVEIYKTNYEKLNAKITIYDKKKNAKIVYRLICPQLLKHNLIDLLNL